MTQIIKHDLESEVPPPIVAMVHDDADPPMVTLRIITQEFMDISAEIADALWRHNVVAATTGKGSSTRILICFGPEP
eukprot:10424894-Prorocentrum_lima.AAC.1